MSGTAAGNDGAMLGPVAPATPWRMAMIRPLVMLVVLLPAFAAAPMAAAALPGISPAWSALPPAEPDALPSPTEVLAVPPALSALLQQRVIAPGHDREQRLHRLAEMIFDRDGMALQYDADATYTVAETWHYRRANCLSFTLLFVSLARAAGIEAHVQEVAQVVSWYQEAGVLYSVGHVNAGVAFDRRRGTIDLDRNVLYDREGPRPISDARALAHFYNNRGAARMAGGDPADARRWFAAALAQARDFTAALNNLGVLETREGNLSRARAQYEQALGHAPRDAATLSNASSLLLKLGQSREAARLQARLASVRQGDPLFHFMLGTQAERAGDAKRAIRHYRNAVRLYDSAHPFHFALARAYLMAGQLERASAELTRAQALGGATQQSRYQQKLDSLQRWRSQQASNRVP